MSRRKAGVLGALMVCCLAAAALATAARPTATVRTAPAAAGCHLGNNGKIKHVIYIQFDNTHFLRDRATVPSDLEQMPNLLNFIKNNGTLLANDHTILISHTAGGILSSLTGLYPDRNGQNVTNSYDFFRPDGSFGFSSSFKYWTDQTDGGNPANSPPTPSADPNYNMVNADPVALGGTGATRNAPAPWVPYARAGCDVGNVGTANAVLENNNAIIFRTGSSSIFATDPTGDMTKVFGEGTPEWNEGKASQLAPSGTAARALAQTDFVGIAVHCAQGSSSICAGNTSARPDTLPDEAGGYSGFSGLFGAKYVNPAITKDAAHPAGTAFVNDTSGHPVADPFGQPGFPGFDGMFARNTLGYVAQMQEHGVPVTYAYISDAHDAHGISGEIHGTYGPGEAGYVQQLHDYDTAFGQFFSRLASDGITKDNTMFVFTVDEGDHGASTPADAPCDGVTTPCTYNNGRVTEINGDLKRLVATYNAQHGTTATTNFGVHSDLAPTVFITGNPARTSTAARDLERAMSDMKVTNLLHGGKESLFAAMADPVEEKALHMVAAGDAARTPTFTPFAQGDYFLNASSTTTCTTGGNPDLDACMFLPAPSGTSSFAWNHGGIQPEIATTWVGFVGPSIENHGIDKTLWSDHADYRPTMLSSLGLDDSYASDGRVLTDILKDSWQPQSLKQHGHAVEDLGHVYKQLNAPFGSFAKDTLKASTRALASSSAGDATYSDVESRIDSLTGQRDTLATQIKIALDGAEFGNTALNENQAKTWIDQANSLLDQAHDLGSPDVSAADEQELQKVDHFVVIYEENHSFDNLYGRWPQTNGLSNADLAHTTQVQQDAARTPFACIPQDDVNLQSPRQKDRCIAGSPQFKNNPFLIDDYLAPTDTTCPPTPSAAFSSPNGFLKGTGSPGGCTRDIVHRFYQEQFQLDGGRQDRYVLGSDAAGLVMGTYDTTALPFYKYLHQAGHPKYAVLDSFFQSAFGGSFLNHQWLIAAATPVDPQGAPGQAHANQHSVLDSNNFPALRSPPATQLATPLYTSPAAGGLVDGDLTQNCPSPNGLACGNFAVNTMQPFAPPFSSFGRQLAAQTNPTIGDRLTDAGVDWAWYAGGWDDAVAGHPDPLFQFHHQPFAYYANYGPGTPGRAHLQDEHAFQSLAAASGSSCQLKPVSFIKPIGEENEHPGYASEPLGSSHLVDLVKSVENSACADSTMVIVTYDEFGGQWDHVPPPGQAGGTAGPHDEWGPGTRIPAVVITRRLHGSFVVDSAEHDTTSILSTLEHRYGLQPLGPRDAAVNDVASAFSATRPGR
jgi:acid phosphatase